MSTLWYVIGTACSDDAFREELVGKVKYGKLTLGDHEELFEFFRVQTPWCPTRWELIEINRVVSLAGQDDGPMPRIVSAWDPAPRTDAFAATIGLGCVDAGLRDAILAGSVEEARQTLSEGPPRVQLTLNQTAELRDLLRRQSGEKSVKDWMEQVELLGWIPTWNPDCEPGATYTSTYFHANPLIISCLQDVQPLKKYLAGEPEERTDRAAIRAKVLQLLQDFEEPEQ